MLTAIARFGTPEMVGKFALGLALTAPVVMFSNLQLRAVIATDARRDFYFRDYLSLRYISTALALFVIVGIALFGGYQKETKAVIIFIGLAKSFEALSDIFYGLRLPSDIERYRHRDRRAPGGVYYHVFWI
jgi:O-antigen/teichoic acid export membrane protein